MTLEQKYFIGMSTYILLALLSLVFAANCNTTHFQKQEVAKVIAAEACGEDFVGMWLVGNTINNRAEQYGIAPYAVVRQPNQYYGYTANNKEELYQQCKKNADKVVDLMYSGRLYDLTDGAIFYRRPDEVKQEWHKEKTISYKNHIFYK